MKFIVGALLLATSLGFFMPRMVRSVAKVSSSQGQGQQLEMSDEGSRDFSLTKSIPRPSDLFRVFNDFDLFSPAPLFKTASTLLATDVKESEDAFEINCDLPGVDKKDIHVKIDGDELQISADRTTEKREKTDIYHRIERQSGHVYRTFTLPDYAERDHVSSEYIDGVLKVKIPKNVELAKKQYEVRMIEVK